MFYNHVQIHFESRSKSNLVLILGAYRIIKSVLNISKSRLSYVRIDDQINNHIESSSLFYHSLLYSE